MQNSVNDTKTTLIDLQLASAYYPILVDLAKQNLLTTYSALVEKAKLIYPNNSIVKSAIPVSTGRRLNVVRMFTSSRELPDLTSLVTSQGTGECGSGFTDSFDPIAARKEVFSYDWSTVSTDFEGFVVDTKTAITPRLKVKETEATLLMSEYYFANKNSLPKSITDHRELIIELIMEGFKPEEAYVEVQKK